MLRPACWSWNGFCRVCFECLCARICRFFVVLVLPVFVSFFFFSDCVLLFSVPDCCNCFLVFGASVFCGMVRCVLPACACVCGCLPFFSGGVLMRTALRK